MRLFSRLSGDDIFISYSRKDGSLYAAGLADELTKKKLSCFIDKLGVKPSHDLTPEFIKKIKNCTILVIVGTEKAASSTFVQKEIRAFGETNRTILPIDFDGHTANAIWYEDIPGLATEAEKDSTALEKGDPSDNVIRFIEKSFNYTRRNQFMARAVWAAAILFVGLITLGIGGYAFANNEANKERLRANQAIADADRAQKQAQAAREDANLAIQQAKDEKARADAEAATAKEKTALADLKTLEAEKAQTIAAEKTKFAAEQQEIALANIKEAKYQQGVAEQKTSEAYNLLHVANMKTADSLYREFNVPAFTGILDDVAQNRRDVEWNYLNQLTIGLNEFEIAQGGPVHDMTYSPDGKFVIARLQGSDTLHKVDVSTGKSELLNDGMWGWNLSISRRRNLLAYCDSDDGVVLWDMAQPSWQKHEIPSTYDSNCQYTYFESESDLVSVGRSGNDLVLQRWDIESKTALGPPKIKTFAGQVEIKGVSQSGRILLSYYKEADRLSQVSLIDRDLNEIPFTTDGGKSIISERSYSISPSGEMAAFEAIDTSIDKHFYVFDARTKNLNKIPSELFENGDLTGIPIRLVFSHDENVAAIVYNNGIKIVDLSKEKILRELPLRPYSAFSFAPGGDYIAIGSFLPSSPATVSRVSLWNIYQPEHIYDFENLIPRSICIKSFGDVECNPSLSKDGSRLIAIGPPGKMGVWDTFNRKKLSEIPIVEGVYFEEFSSNGLVLMFSGSGDSANKARLWNVATGKEILLESADVCAFRSKPK